MLFQKLRMVAAPDDVPGGGGVEEPVSPAGDENPVPPGADDAPPETPGEEGPPEPADQQPPPPAGRRPPTENAIPYSRVQAIVAAQRRQAREEALAELKAELGPVLKQLDPQALRRSIAQEMLTGMGMPPKPTPPKYLTQEDVDRLVGEKLAQHTTRIEQMEVTRQHERLAEQAVREVDRLKTEFGEFFEADPELEQDIADRWGSPRAAREGLSAYDIGKQLIERRKSFAAKWSTRPPPEGAEPTPAPQPLTPLRPGGRPAAAPRSRVPKTDAEVRQAALTLLRQRGVK